MRLAFGCDHAGHPLKEPMISALEQDGHHVLCLGARVLDPDTAMEITREWLATEFSGEERHVRRIQKIAELERGIAPGAGEKTVRREPPPPPPAPPPEGG